MVAFGGHTKMGPDMLKISLRHRIGWQYDEDKRETIDRRIKKSREFCEKKIADLITKRNKWSDIHGKRLQKSEKAAKNLVQDGRTSHRTTKVIYSGLILRKMNVKLAFLSRCRKACENVIKYIADF